MTVRQRRLSVDPRTLERMRDRLSHRGPDEAGLWHAGHIALGHRRLSILDPAGGQQPMHRGSPGQPGHTAITYNGEIYNHLDLRRDLEARGHRFHTTCDTETLLCALSQWGTAALPRLRGMFAFAWYDADQHRLVLARDAMGIKPLYYAIVTVAGGHELVFASEPSAILEHPAMPVEPDWVAVSAYLTSIRTTVGDRSLYQGVHVLQPGEMLLCDLGRDTLSLERQRWHRPTAAIHNRTLDDAVEHTRTVIQASVDAHLISDVPTCTLLSGGLDSAIISTLAAARLPGLRTFSAGAVDDTGDNADPAFAQLVADRIGSVHQPVLLDRDAFTDHWPWMIAQTGVPLSTPNEIAIYLLARALAPHAKVTLSGEGADEIFTGYPLALQFLMQDQLQRAAGQGRDPVEAFIELTSWIAVGAKHQVFTPGVLGCIDGDSALRAHVADVIVPEPDGQISLAVMLRALRHVNLTGLLGRLDTATMLASIEGRTPFADTLVADWADSLPADHHFEMLDAQGPSFLTKRLLRRAYAPQLPQAVLNRPKASFPLPFQTWVEPHARDLVTRATAREVFQPQVLDLVAQQSTAQWVAAWPILNIIHWLEHRWGSQSRAAA